MAELSAQLQPIVCRRCGQKYLARPRAWMHGCPRCGASPMRAKDRLRSNGLAACTALITLGILICGQTMPFISATKLGEVNIYSLLGGIRELYQLGYYFIATILLIFSVIFPVVKLLLILISTSRLLEIPIKTRQRMHRFAVATGKYSILDVLVVAVTIVVIRFGSLAEVKMEMGTKIFCVAIILSILAGFAVELDSQDAQQVPHE